MEKFAGQKHEVNVHLPERELTVHVDAPDVHLEPQIDVRIPEQPAPHVTVEAAEIRVEPPDVHVTVEQPRPSAVRATRDYDGSTVFTVEEETEE